MNRIAQGMTLVLLGVATLTATVPTDLYLNWVKGGFGPFLILTGVILATLGTLVIIAEVRGETQALDEQEVVADGRSHTAHADRDGSGHSGGAGHDSTEEVAEAYASGHSHGHGHDHSRAPRAAWLLLLPVIAVFVVAPPALGSYTAESAGSSGPPPEEETPSGRFDDPLDEAGPDETVQMDIQQFVLRAWVDDDREMAGREIELTGFAVPDEDGDGWYLARLQMACCAADAVVNQVHITDLPEPEADSWWTLRGTWAEPEGALSDVSEHEFEVLEAEEVTDPPDPYE